MVLCRNQKIVQGFLSEERHKLHNTKWPVANKVQSIDAFKVDVATKLREGSREPGGMVII